MIWNISYWSKVLKRILYVIFILLGLYIGLKLSAFYMPFLVAFIISLIIEPTIKFIMQKTGLTRKVSSIIIFLLVSLLILGTLTWLIITIFSEASSLLQGINDYFDKVYIQFQNFISSLNFDKIHLSNEILQVVQNSTAEWMRLGESLEQAAESAQVSNILLNVSEFENIDDATESLVAMSQAYQEFDKIDIVDKLNNIGM